MRILVAACGSRGDFQPMLALAVALKARGHAVRMAGTRSFADEARAFGFDFAPAGIDVARFMDDNREAMTSPASAMRLFNRVMVEEWEQQIAALPAAVGDAELVVGGGALLGARSAAEAAGVPYRYVAYTPQVFPSPSHPPFMVPVRSAPAAINRFFWASVRWFYNRVVLERINAFRRRAGIFEVASVIDHVFDQELSMVAADPEIWPAPPDVSSPQFGSVFLADTRPLPPDLHAFLAAGPAPVYVGFGSLTDAAPEETTRRIVEAAHRAGVRLVLSSGWARLGGAAADREDVYVLGPASHWLLFPKVAAVVHHGGAGTTAAAARAGVPQVVVPHAFDQFATARSATRAGVGVSLPRTRLRAESLAAALKAALRPDVQRKAAAAGERIRARDANALAAEWMEGAVQPRASLATARS